MRKLCICLLALVLALAPATALAAKLVKPGSDFYYLDEANVLDRDTEGEIFFCNQLLKEACGAQIVVVALDDIGGADIFEYATDLAEEWGVGDPSEQNGVLLLMTIENEDYYVTTGRGVRGIFPSSTLKQMTDKYLEPDFAAGRYGEGARKFFEAVFTRVAEYYNLELTPADGVAKYESYASSAHGRGFGGASGYVNESANRYDYDYGYGYDEPYEEDGFSILGLIVALIVVLVVLRFCARFMRFSGGFWTRHPFVTGLFLGSAARRSFHPYDGPGPGPGPGPRGPRRRPPRGGGFGGGFGGGGFTGGFGRGGGGFSGGGFGGARGGGGGGFGGGAGRGRH